MNERVKDRIAKKENRKLSLSWIFLGTVLGLYLIILPFSTQRIMNAIFIDFRTILQMILPLFIAFLIMFFINLYVGPKKIADFMGRRIGIRGVLFSSLAGIISMGPIYAWYPMLKGFREKGVPVFYLSNFLGNRAIKPFLLPMMILFFGWVYTIFFNILVWISSIVASCLVSRLCHDISGDKKTDNHGDSVYCI
ncbi:MAG: hypothetical protein JW882_02360 [Deltaproteobacteria bacterium]|nr:hypothetical protein [Deltaproteobacteria bacterium]